MVVGSLGGVAVLFELVWLAHRHQLDTRMHSPNNVLIGAACFLVFGWGLALVAAKAARGLGMFTAAGAWAAASIAVSSGEQAYAMPLLVVGFVATVVCAASYSGDHRMRRARMS